MEAKHTKRMFAGGRRLAVLDDPSGGTVGTARLGP
jgi:hypothetical protein